MKKEEQIIGSILFLTVGKHARILTDSGLLRTSRVEHFIRHPDGSVWIETLHTKYTVLPL